MPHIMLIAPEDTIKGAILYRCNRLDIKYVRKGHQGQCNVTQKKILKFTPQVNPIK